MGFPAAILRGRGAGERSFRFCTGGVTRSSSEDGTSNTSGFRFGEGRLSFPIAVFDATDERAGDTDLLLPGDRSFVEGRFGFTGEGAWFERV